MKTQASNILGFEKCRILEARVGTGTDQYISLYLLESQMARIGRNNVFAQKKSVPYSLDHEGPFL